MRLFVVYDANGDISTAATQPEGAPEIGAVLEGGEKSGFVEVPEVPADADHDTKVAVLHEVMRRYRVSHDYEGLRIAERDGVERTD